MVKSQYFCDRCGREQPVGGKYALFEVVVNRVGQNAFKTAVCSECSQMIYTFCTRQEGSAP